MLRLTIRSACIDRATRSAELYTGKGDLDRALADGDQAIKLHPG